MEMMQRAIGGVVGLAVGDALGAPFEFLRGRNVPDPIPALERPWMDLPPGSTTDDTAMARNLMRSLATRGGFDPDDLVERHLAWFADDPPDVGTLTGRVLRRVASGEDAAAAARAIWEQRGPEVSAGNGSVMYCAPLGAFRAARPELLVEEAPALSTITHWDPRCRTACLAVSLTAAALVRGVGPETAVVDALAAVQEREGGEELEFLVGEAGRSRPVDGPDMGFVLFTAGLALVVAPLLGGLGSDTLTAHMLEHVTVGDAGVALLVLAVRGPLLFFLLPAPVSRCVARRRGLRACAASLARPSVALAGWAAAYAAWHVPAAYELALAHEPVHAVEHAWFVAAGALVWTQLVDPARRERLSLTGRLAFAGVLFAFGQVLCNVLLLAPEPLFGAYADAPDALRDQQLAGLVMMVEQTTALGVFAALMLRPALRSKAALATPSGGGTGSARAAV